MALILRPILQHYLGDFVTFGKFKCQDKWGTTRITLENVRLHPHVCDNLDLPVDVKTALVERVAIKIPNIFKVFAEPTVVIVEGIYLLASHRANPSTAAGGAKPDDAKAHLENAHRLQVRPQTTALWFDRSTRASLHASSVTQIADVFDCLPDLLV